MENNSEFHYLNLSFSYLLSTKQIKLCLFLVFFFSSSLYTFFLHLYRNSKLTIIFFIKKLNKSLDLLIFIKKNYHFSKK